MGIVVQEFRGIADLEYLVILVILEFLAIRDLELVDIVVFGFSLLFSGVLGVFWVFSLVIR